MELHTYAKFRFLIVNIMLFQNEVLWIGKNIQDDKLCQTKWESEECMFSKNGLKKQTQTFTVYVATMKWTI